MKFYIFMILILNIVNVQSLTEVVIILGCSDNFIQNQRVEAGLDYLKHSKFEKILYLSGGIKNELKNELSESSKMLKQINNQNINAKIILDEKSKNTAENFVNLKKWLDNNHLYNMFSYVIVTSDFHKERALRLFNGIFENIKAKVILSKSECNRCWNDENYHMNNVDSDIMKALIFLN